MQNDKELAYILNDDIFTLYIAKNSKIIYNNEPRKIQREFKMVEKSEIINELHEDAEVQKTRQNIKRKFKI